MAIVWKGKYYTDMTQLIPASLTACLPALALLAMLLGAPARAANRIILSYELLEFDLTPQELDQFITKGTIPGDLKFLAQRFSRDRLLQVRQQLNTPIPLTPIQTARFTYTPAGETALQQLGTVIKPDNQTNGFYAIRSALITAANNSQGITFSQFIQQFPSETLRLDLKEARSIVQALSAFTQERRTTVARIEQFATAQASKPSPPHPDFGKPGDQTWQKTSKSIPIAAKNLQSQRSLAIDLYLPTHPHPKLIVISHGLAQRRISFAYLAEHLASHGFAVVVPEHPGSNYQRVKQFIQGNDSDLEPQDLIDRSADLSELLNALERDPNLRSINFQNVGIIGHSLGSFTALTLAGATLNFDQIQQDCARKPAILNISRLLQCQASRLPQGSAPVTDPRFKAIFLMNPLGSTLLGERGFNQVQVPAMILGGEQDLITPIVEEQIRPYSWLRSPQKYLAIVHNGTHLSAQTVVTNQQLFPSFNNTTPPNPAIIHGYVKALALPFFQTHLNNQANPLNAAYGQALSQPQSKLTLISNQTP